MVYRLNIAGVRHEGGHGFQLFQQGAHVFSRTIDKSQRLLLTIGRCQHVIAYTLQGIPFIFSDRYDQEVEFHYLFAR